MAEPTREDWALAEHLFRQKGPLTIAQSLADARAAGANDALEKAAKKLSLMQGNRAATRRIGLDRAARIICALKDQPDGE